MPGLRAEAASQEELLEELKVLIPALLLANDANLEGDAEVVDYEDYH